MDLIAAALLAAAAGQAVLDQGGFRPGSREIFGALALAALAAAVAVDRGAALLAARRPVAIVLWVLAAAGALSAVWTDGLVGDALRWGLVTGGYGALFVAASVLAGRHRRAPETVATAIAVLATISAGVGLSSVAAHDSLFADYIRGTWRPGGTLEYSAALSLLAVCALPAALRGMCRRPAWIVAPAAACGTICAATLALDRSRAELALAVVIALAAVVAPGCAVAASRTRVAGALATLAVAAIAARVVAGAPVHMAATPHPARTGAQLAAACLGPALIYLASVGRRASEILRRRGWLVSATAGAVMAAGLIAVIPGHHAGIHLHGGSGGFWHGRLTLWHKTIETAEDRPLIGGGADGFLAASLVHQPSSPIRFAHDLPLEFAAELGIAGLVLALALYGATVRELWQRRSTDGAFLLAPAGAAFLVANLIDWPWHLAGCGAVWAAALGALSVTATAPSALPAPPARSTPSRPRSAARYVSEP